MWPCTIHGVPVCCKPKSIGSKTSCPGCSPSPKWKLCFFFGSPKSNYSSLHFEKLSLRNKPHNAIGERHIQQPIQQWAEPREQAKGIESPWEMTPSQFAKPVFDTLGKDTAMETGNKKAEDWCSVHLLDVGYALKIKPASLEWAASLKRIIFYNYITALLKEHPLDGLGEDSEPLFWLGLRKAPTPLMYCDGSTWAKNINKLYCWLCVIHCKTEAGSLLF
jgi:hypothetical protein